MSTQKHIIKVGVVITDSNRLLLVRKRGGVSFILPGGKPEFGEDDAQTLRREIDEELGCQLDESSVVFLAAFSDVAADLSDTLVTVKLYEARLVGTPEPRSEIECMTWVSATSSPGVTLAPSLQNHIIPFLQQKGMLVAN